MFLSPLFLIGGAIAATAPLLLHLLQRRRRSTRPFPTLRFLQLAEHQSCRRMRMENLLLWFLRTAIMLLIGMAFAMPVIRARNLAWLGRAPRDVAIVIDASYSMGYQSGRGTLWDEALNTATRIIGGLTDADRYCLYLAREAPEALIAEPVGGREQGIQQLKAASLETTGSHLLPTIQAVRSVLDRDPQGREQEIHVLTDGQSLPWKHEAGGSGEEPVDRSTATRTRFVALLGPPAPVNLGPRSLTLDPPIVLRDAPARIQVSTLHNGPDRASTVRLFIDDEEIGRRPLQLGSDAAGTIEFTMPPRRPGVYPARVETPDDALAVDNTFYFLVRVRDQLPVLCVGSDEDTLYLRTALRAGLTGVGGVEPERVEPGEIADHPLHDIAAVFLCNALPLPGQALAALELYVRTGGLLVVFPGDRAALSDYDSWTVLPGQGGVQADFTAMQRARTLSWPTADHPLVRPFQRGLAAPRLTVRRSLGWNKLNSNASSLIMQGADHAFLLERAVGEGRVLQFAVTADRTWSNFPLSPFYLPLLSRVVEYSAGVGIAAPSLWTTQGLLFASAVPGATRDTVLLDPNANPLPVSSAVIDGNPQLRVEGLTQPGIYSVEGRGPALALNLPREESDLSRVTHATIEGLLGGEDLHISRNADELQQLIETHRVGRTYGEHLLWVLFVLLLTEFIYANRLSRGGPALSAQLDLDPSGRMTGHREPRS